MSTDPQSVDDLRAQDEIIMQFILGVTEFIQPARHQPVTSENYLVQSQAVAATFQPARLTSEQLEALFTSITGRTNVEMMATKNQELPAPARPPHHHIDLGNHKPILLGDKPDFVLKVMYSGKENDACQDSRDYLLDLWKRNHALRRFYFLYREWSYDSLPSTLRSHTDATLMELLAAHPQKATEVFLSTILMLHMHPDYQPKRTDEIRKLVQWLADHVCEGGCILKPLDAELCFPCQADKVLLYDSPTDESTKVALWYLAEIAKLRRCRSTEDN